MGLLSWLFGGRRQAPATDQIWLTPDSKYRGMARQAADALSQSKIVCIVAHFPATLEELQAAVDWPSQVRFMLASEMDPLSGSSPTNDSDVEVLAAERHFCREKDEELVVFCQSLPVPCSVRFHLSMEDPLMKQFVGAAIAEMLQQIGMEDDASVESSMVSRRIAAAQQKLCSDAERAMRAPSASEWLRMNGHSQE